jgi:hypothetical protein
MISSWPRNESLGDPEGASAPKFVFFFVRVIEIAGEVGLFSVWHAFARTLVERDGLTAVDARVLLLSRFPHRRTPFLLMRLYHQCYAQSMASVIHCRSRRGYQGFVRAPLNRLFVQKLDNSTSQSSS